MLPRMDQKLRNSTFYLPNHDIKRAGTIINILFIGAEEDNSLPVSQKVNVFKMLFLLYLVLITLKSPSYFNINGNGAAGACLLTSILGCEAH